MFGCGLPVCAVDFPWYVLGRGVAVDAHIIVTCSVPCCHILCSLHELVQHGKNGLVFDNEQQLAEQMIVSCSLCSLPSLRGYS